MTDAAPHQRASSWEDRLVLVGAPWTITLTLLTATLYTLAIGAYPVTVLLGVATLAARAMTTLLGASLANPTLRTERPAARAT